LIGQKPVPAGGNEITAARELLQLLDLKGALVTGDAIHCQHGTAALVLARGGDYLLALKANRPAMLAEVEAFFADPPPDSVRRCETTDAEHGRIELRRHAVSHDVAWLASDRRYPGEAAMPGLACIARVEATVERDGRTTTSQRYYLSSAALTPERFATAVRAHWGIENGVHFSSRHRLRPRIAPAIARITAPKTSPSSANSPSTSSNAPAQTSPSAANANAPAGPTPSQDPSSAKCNDPGARIVDSKIR
ncbi:MAG: ISAs1 family transposase, partial [Rhodospirillales bacterium]